MVRPVLQDWYAFTDIQFHGKAHVFSRPTVDKFLARRAVTKHPWQDGADGTKGGPRGLGLRGECSREGFQDGPGTQPVF